MAKLTIKRISGIDTLVLLEYYAACRTGKIKNSYSINGYNYIRNGLNYIISHVAKRSYKWEVSV